MQSVKIIGKACLGLQRVMRRDYKPHLLQICSVCHEFGNDQMAGMDGVEGAEKKADPLWLRHGAILKVKNG